MSQPELAAKVTDTLRTGQKWTRDLVAARERPDRPTPLSVDELLALARAFQVPVWDLLAPWTGPCLACGPDRHQVQHLVDIGYARYDLVSFTRTLLGLPGRSLAFRTQLEEELGKEYTTELLRLVLQTMGKDITEPAVLSALVEYLVSDPSTDWSLFPVLIQYAHGGFGLSVTARQLNPALARTLEAALARMNPKGT